MKLSFFACGMAMGLRTVAGVDTTTTTSKSYIHAQFRAPRSVGTCEPSEFDLIIEYMFKAEELAGDATGVRLAVPETYSYTLDGTTTDTTTTSFETTDTTTTTTTTTDTKTLFVSPYNRNLETVSRRLPICSLYCCNFYWCPTIPMNCDNCRRRVEGEEEEEVVDINERNLVGMKEEKEQGEVGDDSKERDLAVYSTDYMLKDQIVASWLDYFNLLQPQLFGEISESCQEVVKAFVADADVILDDADIAP